VSDVATQSRLVRVQDKGQITLPIAARRRLGLKKGDLVEVADSPEGLMLTPRQSPGMQALDELGALLREAGVTLDDWIESSREVRGQLMQEIYGMRPRPEDD
jgi:AbrB family looped-hinge helix DNA binding protein